MRNSCIFRTFLLLVEYIGNNRDNMHIWIICVCLKSKICCINLFDYYLCDHARHYEFASAEENMSCGVGMNRSCRRTKAFPRIPFLVGSRAFLSC